MFRAIEWLLEFMVNTLSRVWLLGVPAKDPMDWSKTRGSTGWSRETYCTNCKATTDHEDRMVDMCRKCGTFDQRMYYHHRAARLIWNGRRWMLQRKYGNGPGDYTLD